MHKFSVSMELSMKNQFLISEGNKLQWHAKHKCQLIQGRNEMETAIESDNKLASMLQRLLYNYVFSSNCAKAFTNNSFVAC